VVDDCYLETVISVRLDEVHVMIRGIGFTGGNGGYPVYPAGDQATV